MRYAKAHYIDEVFEFYIGSASCNGFISSDRQADTIEQVSEIDCWKRAYGETSAEEEVIYS